MFTNEGAKRGIISRRGFPLGEGTGLNISPRVDTNIAGPGFIVDAMTTIGECEDPELSAIAYKQRFSSFEALRSQLEVGGYQMSMPRRNEQSGKNNAAAAVTKDGKLIATLTFVADSSLTQGSVVTDKKPELGKPSR